MQEHIREVHETLPRGYYRELPELSSGPLAGYPRVYELAITLVSHTEARIDRDNLDLFVAAFQSSAPLSIGELWAVPAMLRLTRGSYPPLAQIEQWIGDRALGAEEATARATQHLALTQVIVAHSITSLRNIAHLDWPSFVEGQSAMEAVRRDDPAAFYPRMTFATRDRYRHAVERIARRTGRREEDVARLAVDLARSEARAAWLAVVLLALVPACDLAISAVNQLVTAFLPPRALPKLDLHGHGGIPAEFRTAVVIPTLFGDVEAVHEALENLEVQFLANRESHLHFAVLSDFPDAPTEPGTKWSYGRCGGLPPHRWRAGSNREMYRWARRKAASPTRTAGRTVHVHTAWTCRNRSPQS